MLEIAVVFAAQYLIYVEILAFCLFLLLARRRVRIRLVLITLIAFPLAYVAARIASFFWYDARPFVVTGAVPLFEHAADNGFPSDHMLLAATIAAIVTLRYPRIAIIFWGMAIAIGAARVVAAVHHPTDIAASIIIGVASAFAAYYIVVLRRMRMNEVIN